MTDAEYTKTYLTGRGVNLGSVSTEKFNHIMNRICKTCYVVYKHIRKTSDNKLPFYIGMGSESRAYQIGRNRYWQNIYDKNGRDVIIIAHGLTQLEADRLEIKLIKHYRLLGCAESNIQDGGGGNLDPLYAKETMDMLSISTIHQETLTHVANRDTKLCYRICSFVQILKHNEYVSETVTQFIRYIRQIIL